MSEPGTDIVHSIVCSPGLCIFRGFVTIPIEGTEDARPGEQPPHTGSAQRNTVPFPSAEVNVIVPPRALISR